MKLFKKAGLKAAMKQLAVELRRLAWLGMAIAAGLTGMDAQVATFVVAALWWTVLQVAAFVLTARADDGNDTS